MPVTTPPSPHTPPRAPAVLSVPPAPRRRPPPLDDDDAAEPFPPFANMFLLTPAAPFVPPRQTRRMLRFGPPDDPRLEFFPKTQ
jgi:hypothetical protein